MALTAQALVEDVGSLVSLPEVALQIYAVINDEHAGAAEISQVICQDPDLAARLLRIANSTMYRDVNQIDSINRAVSILGTKQIRDIVIFTAAVKVFDDIPNDLIAVADFWHHNLYCALLAWSLATQSHQANADSLFTAGLLHDIGHLLMFNRLPQEDLAAIMPSVQAKSKDIIDVERKFLGFDHMEVGAHLVKQWHLPEVIIECVAQHHTPSQAQQHATAVAHLHIANAIASLPYDAIPTSEDVKRIEPAIWEMVGLRVEDIGDAVQAAQSQIGEMQQALFGDVLG